MEGAEIQATSTGSARTTTFPAIDHNHPLFLQHTETPGSSLISLQLTGSENYALWSRSFRIGLVGRSKLGFVDGRFIKSMFESELHDQWEKCNAVVLSWIMNAVRPGLLSSVVYASDARKVWLDLRERFDTVNGSRIFQLHREIHSLTQGTMSIADYHSKLRDLWDEYDAIMPCPSCPCPESKKFGEHCDYQRLLQFLMGLNESYSPPRSQILMMSPIPSLNKAYAMLIDQESQRSLASNSSSASGVLEGTTMYTQRNHTYNNGAGSSKVHSTSSFSGAGDHGGGYNNSASSSGGSYKTRKNFIQCEHCGCKGHSREQCYKIVGYPTDFKSKRKPLNTGMYANQVDLPPNLGQETIGCSNKGKNISGAGPHTGAFFTSAQYQQILQLLSRPGDENTTVQPSANIATTDDADLAPITLSCNYANKQWIIDTGASHHITSDLGLLDRVREVHAQGDSKVHLPNGKVAAVTHIGSTCVLANQSISNVLFLADFKFNLLSVSRITRKLQCMVCFFLTFVFSKTSPLIW